MNPSYQSSGNFPPKNMMLNGVFYFIFDFYSELQP